MVSVLNKKNYMFLDAILKKGQNGEERCYSFQFITLLYSYSCYLKCFIVNNL